MRLLGLLAPRSHVRFVFKTLRKLVFSVRTGMCALRTLPLPFRAKLPANIQDTHSCEKRVVESETERLTAFPKSRAQ